MAQRVPVGEAREREQRILAVVRRIPRGRIATYGQVAALAGLPGRARLVGRVLRELPAGSRIPWHRVVGAAGRVSDRGGTGWEEGLQRALLADEGVAPGRGGHIDLERFAWRPGPCPPPGPV